MSSFFDFTLFLYEIIMPIIIKTNPKIKEKRENTGKPIAPIPADSFPVNTEKNRRTCSRKGKRTNAIIIMPIAIKLLDNIKITSNYLLPYAHWSSIFILVIN